MPKETKEILLHHSKFLVRHSIFYLRDFGLVAAEGLLGPWGCFGFFVVLFLEGLPWPFSVFISKS